MEPGIRDIQYYIPSARLGNKELMSEQGFEESFLKDKLGIEERPICSPSEACSDLAIGAARKVIEGGGISPEDIGLLVLCTQNPDYKLPGTSHIIQDRLGIPHRCATFDVGLGCSGFVYGLGIAKAFMTTHGIAYGLLVTSDPYSKVIAKDDRNTRPIFGDAATATLLGGESNCKMLRFTFNSDGSGFHHLIVEGGGSRYPCNDQGGEGIQVSPHLFMDGRAIFNFMMTRVPQDVQECLRINGLGLEEIDFFVFHQASRYMLDNLARRLGLPREKVVYSLRETGNTVSSSIPVALCPFLHENRIAGKKVLISGFGVGLSWASTVLYFS